MFSVKPDIIVTH